MQTVIDVSEHILGDPKHATMHRNMLLTSSSIPAVFRKEKKELCSQKNALWNLLHDMDIESIELQK